MGNLLLVMLGGAIGTGARHLVGRGFLAAVGPGFPWGTMAINLTGSLLMGILAGTLARLGPSGETWRLFLGVGVLGGYTTFSAFSLEAVLLWQRGASLAAVGYVGGSVVGGLTALIAGLALTRALVGAGA